MKINGLEVWLELGNLYAKVDSEGAIKHLVALKVAILHSQGAVMSTSKTLIFYRHHRLGRTVTAVVITRTGDVLTVGKPVTKMSVFKYVKKQRLVRSLVRRKK